MGMVECITASFPEKCIKALGPLQVELLGLANNIRGSLVKFDFRQSTNIFYINMSRALFGKYLVLKLNLISCILPSNPN